MSDSKRDAQVALAAYLMRGDLRVTSIVPLFSNGRGEPVGRGDDQWMYEVRGTPKFVTIETALYEVLWSAAREVCGAPKEATKEEVAERMMLWFGERARP